MKQLLNTIIGGNLEEVKKNYMLNYRLSSFHIDKILRVACMHDNSEIISWICKQKALPEHMYTLACDVCVKSKKYKHLEYLWPYLQNTHLLWTYLNECIKGNDNETFYKLFELSEKKVFLQLNKNDFLSSALNNNNYKMIEWLLYRYEFVDFTKFNSDIISLFKKRQQKILELLYNKRKLFNNDFLDCLFINACKHNNMIIVTNVSSNNKKYAFKEENKQIVKYKIFDKTKNGFTDSDLFDFIIPKKKCIY